VIRGVMSEDVAYIAWKHRDARQDNDIMFLCRCFCIESVNSNNVRRLSIKNTTRSLIYTCKDRPLVNILLVSGFKLKTFSKIG
jgi:hypothetical protein